MKAARTILAVALATAAGIAIAQPRELRIAHIYGKTGALEAYAKQTQAGLQLGLEYATGGKMEVLGRKIVIIEKDDQIKPDIAKSALATAYGDDKADIAIGPTSSASALAMLPVAEEYNVGTGAPVARTNMAAAMPYMAGIFSTLAAAWRTLRRPAAARNAPTVLVNTDPVRKNTVPYESASSPNANDTTGSP
jgi:ABC-type branched-subunit amino acid transport system substrate-binding protein